jgi:hypothetical protein
MSNSEDQMRAYARSLLADALAEDYVDDKCCECGNATLAQVDNILKCDTCGNQQRPSGNRPH